MFVNSVISGVLFQEILNDFNVWIRDTLMKEPRTFYSATFSCSKKHNHSGIPHPHLSVNGEIMKIVKKMVRCQLLFVKACYFPTDTFIKDAFNSCTDNFF